MIIRCSVASFLKIAARAHLDHLDTIIEAAMDEANISFSELDGVAATSGPGLIGGVMVGMMAGKAIAARMIYPSWVLIT